MTNQKWYIRVHYKEMLILAGNGEVASTLEKGLRLPPWSQQPAEGTWGLVFLQLWLAMISQSVPAPQGGCFVRVSY